jgi:glucuronoarabinoxylan endo-1,4-beta-xylanase
MASWGGETGINDYGKPLPSVFVLKQNYPNPFNCSPVISYELPSLAPVIVNIYDILGRKVETLPNTNQETGEYNVVWNAVNKSAGIYFYRLQAGDYTETRKMLLLK